MDEIKPVNVGESLQRLRGERGLSMRALAKISGLSANALSMIERGRTSPSVSTLYKLAEALNVPVTAFFGAPEEREQVIHLRANERARVPIVRGTWEGLGGEKFTGRVEPFVLSLDTSADSGPTPMVHTGHEFVFCLAGKIEYLVEESRYALSPGDSLLFAAHMVHRWRNSGQGPATVLIVLSGFTESDHPLAIHVPKQNS
ncbi:MAG: XRE family transcriptional regulator [Anaerolineales bacterium]|jgi:transcriptional regulator with XRE-family HTH domain